VRRSEYPVAGHDRLLLRILGAIWLLDGILQLQPAMFTRSFVNDIIAPTAQGQPDVVSGPVHWAVHLIAPHIAFYNALFATTQLVIGVCLLIPFAVRPALAVSVLWSVAVWWLAEGLGGILSGSASILTGGPGAVILYAMAGVAMWPLRSPDGGPDVALHESAKGRILVGGGWLVIWGGAALSLVQHSLASQIDDSASMTEGWISNLDRHLASFTGRNETFTTVVGIALFIFVGAGILRPRLRRPALVSGLVLAILFWGFGQGFGGLVTGSATDPNAAPLYALLALILWPAKPPCEGQVQFAPAGAG
jgi:hypothetical protein